MHNNVISRSEFENKSDGYIRAFMDNRLQTIRAATNSEEAAEATTEEVPARRARGRHASEQARARFLAKIDRLRHSVLSARARHAASGSGAEVVGQSASESEAELRPQRLFESDADEHEHEHEDTHQQSVTYKSGHWTLKHVDSEGEVTVISIEHLSEHTVHITCTAAH